MHPGLNWYLSIRDQEEDSMWRADYPTFVTGSYSTSQRLEDAAHSSGFKPDGTVFWKVCPSPVPDVSLSSIIMEDAILQNALLCP